MEIGSFLARTRHVRSFFQHEGAYRFPDCDALISCFCDTVSISRSDIVFHPAYTSRASPELIYLKGQWHVVWDYHFAEMTHAFNITTLALLLHDIGDPVLTASIDRRSILDHFRASLLRYLSCQLFRHPHLGLAFAEAHAQVAIELLPRIRRDLADHVTVQRQFQWSYVLVHELAHICFGRLSGEDKKLEFKWTIDLIKNGLSYGAAQLDSERSQRLEVKWWSEDTAAFEELRQRFGAMIGQDFDAGIAEEMFCDNIALRVSMMHWCLNHGTPFDFRNSDCLSAMERARSAVNILNNYLAVLDVLRMFWTGLAKRGEPSGRKTAEEGIEKQRKAAIGATQQVFLRGSFGLEGAWYGAVASALGRRELRLDDPDLLAHAEKSRREREVYEGVEGFDERFGKAWHELKEEAGFLMADEMVEWLFGSAAKLESRLSPQQALDQAQRVLGWK